MNQIASKGQLRMSLLRWILFIVPLVILLGFLVSQFAGWNEDNRWFAQISKPDAQPSVGMFLVIWLMLQTMVGSAFAMIVHARGAPLQSIAIILFLTQFALNLFWPILYFGMHQVSAAFWLLAVILLIGLATTFVFGRIRKAAAWLMVPYLAWLCFAAILNKQIDWLNPNAETLVVPAARTQI